MMEEIWKCEDITETCLLYRRVHEDKVRNLIGNSVPPVAYKNTPLEDPDLSTHWNRYRSPHQVRELIAKEYKARTTIPKDPAKFFIASIQVSAIANICDNHDVPRQDVRHTPKQIIPEEKGNPNDRSHSSIIGDKTEEEIRVLMARVSRWSIPPPEVQQS